MTNSKNTIPADASQLRLVIESQQRQQYYSNRRLAEVEPEKYMSVIIDGMQQSHSELPYFGIQKYGFERTLK
jgi:hypothetical protein